MRIATYNVRVDTDYDKNWSWDYRAQDVMALIEFHNWDIVGLQELRPNQIEDLSKMKHYQLLANERDGDGQGEGIGILYKKDKFKVIDQGYFWLSNTPDQPSIHPTAAYPRICVWVILQDKRTSQCQLVADVHLDNISEEARYQGMAVVLTQLKALISSYPTIILGDFNAEPDERVHQLLAKTFINAKTLPEIQHYGPTGSFQNFDYHAAWKSLENIDYIYTKNYTIERTGVLTDSFENKYASDHFPLVAVLEIAQNK